jgi:hypothetical protein
LLCEGQTLLSSPFLIFFSRSSRLISTPARVHINAHYQKIVVALSDTIRLMAEIDSHIPCPIQ